MLEIIVFLFPSVFGLKLFMNLNKDKSIFEYIIYYLLLVLFTNFLVIFIFNYVSKGAYNNIELLTTDFSFTTQYMFSSILLNVILPVIFTIVYKYITFDIEVENEKKVKKQKNSKRK